MTTHTQKIWLVTGSSRGLGRSIVAAALGAGDCVVASARQPEQLQDLVEQYGARVHAVTPDVTDPESASRAVEAAVTRFGRLDILVNNAGYGDTAAIEDMTLEAFKAQMDTNFYGVVYLCKAAVPVMRKQGAGHIFQISSIGGRIGVPGLSAYQSAKWAVGGFSTILAQEVAPLGIKVTVLEPGGMRTDWAGSSMAIPPVSEPYEQTVGAFAKMIRASSGTEPTDPAKVAQVILAIAALAEPPLRLLIGGDAVAYAAGAAAALAEADTAWRHLSESVGFAPA